MIRPAIKRKSHNCNVGLYSSNNTHISILGRIACITSMRHIATYVASSVVCVSVCVFVARMYCAKTAQPIQISFVG